VDELIIKTYPPLNIEEIVMQKGFFHKILLPIYSEEEE
tara:strand:- start:559 stop:672 length:114 start_codon:yes stop_codon:yes gene_type:complete